MTTNIEIFDPALCCATGVCGPAVDPELSRFFADVDWLIRCGASVQRFNLAKDPGLFAQNEAVRSALEEVGEEALPLVMVDGQVVCSGEYPSRAQLAKWAGVSERNGKPKVAKGSCCGPEGCC